MPRLLTIAAAAAVFSAGVTAADFDHSDWDAIVRRHVNAIGEVDYAAIKADRARLDRYVAALAAASPDSHRDRFPTRADELAYWLNAYNALVTRGVVDAWPTRSVRDLGTLFGFFRRSDYVLGGRRLSLQSLENQIIRARYRDPRIHFAIVCASLSCPRLAGEAFFGARLDQQLDALTRTSLAESRMVTIDTSAKTLRLSSLFKWYAADFGSPLPAFLRRYLSPERAGQLDALGPQPRIRYFDYDWSINDPGSRAKARQPQERELAAPAAGRGRSGMAGPPPPRIISPLFPAAYGRLPREPLAAPATLTMAEVPPPEPRSLTFEPTDSRAIRKNEPTWPDPSAGWARRTVLVPNEPNQANPAAAPYKTNPTARPVHHPAQPALVPNEPNQPTPAAAPYKTNPIARPVHHPAQPVLAPNEPDQANPAAAPYKTNPTARPVHHPGQPALVPNEPNQANPSAAPYKTNPTARPVHHPAQPALVPNEPNGRAPRRRLLVLAAPADTW